MKLTLFGGFHLTDSIGNVPVLSARKSKALLAWLSIHPDNKHPREKLATLLWPDSEEVAARHSLRQALAELRKVIPAESNILDASKEFILLNSAHMEIDVQSFLGALSKGDDESLDKAIELYSGEFLEGCNPHSDMFEEWGMTFRNNFNERAAIAIDSRISQHLIAQNYRQVIDLAIRLIAIDPVRESAYRALMLSHLRLENGTSALRWYRRCQCILKQELNVIPDKKTEALYQEELNKKHDREGHEDSEVCQNTSFKSQLKNSNSNNLFLNKVSEEYSNSVSKDNIRVLYQIEMAMAGVLDLIGGQSLLIRGEGGVGKSELITKIKNLAKSKGFVCCRKKLSTRRSNFKREILKELTFSISNCLLRFKNNSGLKHDIKNKCLCVSNSYHETTKDDKKMAELIKVSSSSQPVLLIVEDIHEANMETLNLLAELISSAGNSSMLLLMTSRFEGEPLDPVWRGAMKGAPLTTIDMT